MDGFGRIFADGFSMVRERAGVYAALAGLCALAEAWAAPHTDVVGALYAAVGGNPGPLVFGPPLGIVLGFSLLAQFAIVPTAVLRVEPQFKTTAAAIVMMIATVAVVGTLTNLGYVFAILPGIAIGVLLSQALIGTLARTTPQTTIADLPHTLATSMRASFSMTRDHFLTTLGIVALSLALVVLPFSIAAFWFVVLAGKYPGSVVACAPLLLIAFVYLECARYALVVRWYARLQSFGAGQIA